MSCSLADALLGPAIDGIVDSYNHSQIDIELEVGWLLERQGRPHSEEDVEQALALSPRWHGYGYAGTLHGPPRPLPPPGPLMDLSEVMKLMYPAQIKYLTDPDRTKYLRKAKGWR